MSYQQTCMDSFPEGDTKTEIEKALQISKELTSNSLVIVSQLSSILSSIQKPKRRLLSDSKHRSLHEENFVTWMNTEERRMLKVDPPKQKPDVTVAKDGSGDLKQSMMHWPSCLKTTKEGMSFLLRRGVYEENVLGTKKMVNITIFGDGSLKTII